MKQAHGWGRRSGLFGALLIAWVGTANGEEGRGYILLLGQGNLGHVGLFSALERVAYDERLTVFVADPRELALPNQQSDLFERLSVKNPADTAAVLDEIERLESGGKWTLREVYTVQPECLATQAAINAKYGLFGPRPEQLPINGFAKSFRSEIEIVVDALQVEGNMHLLGALARPPLTEPLREPGYLLASPEGWIPGAILSHVFELNSKEIAARQIQNTHVHTVFGIDENQEIRLLRMELRPPDGALAFAYQQHSGVLSYEAGIRAGLGLEISNEPTDSRAVALRILYAPETGYWVRTALPDLSYARAVEFRPFVPYGSVVRRGDPLGSLVAQDVGVTQAIRALEGMAEPIRLSILRHASRVRNAQTLLEEQRFVSPDYGKIERDPATQWPTSFRSAGLLLARAISGNGNGHVSSEEHVVRGSTEFVELILAGFSRRWEESPRLGSLREIFTRVAQDVEFKYLGTTADDVAQVVTHYRNSPKYKGFLPEEYRRALSASLDAAAFGQMRGNNGEGDARSGEVRSRLDESQGGKGIRSLSRAEMDRFIRQGRAAVAAARK